MLQTKNTNACEKFTCYALLFLGVLGALHIAAFLPISETAILELIFLITSLISLFNYGINKNALIIGFLSLVYLIYSW
ncbi:hypothetical protein PJ242_22800, partial [Escherichia coli]|nr:hypothetical protein [Escherichia coli]